VIDMAGDSVLAVFETASGAVGAALAVQRALAESVRELAEEKRMRFRIGVHLGDVIEKDDGTVYGDGVNIAARLEGLAEPGGIAVSDAIRSAVRGKLGAELEDLGEQTVKNIAEPVRAYRVKVVQPAAARDAPQLALPDKPSIAVLPFDNLSGDPEQEYFADGVVEAITATLSRIRSFFVIARNSAFAYKGKSPDLRQVGKELGVRYVLEGSVQKAANRVRITVQLIDATNGAHVWADRIDGSLEDIFELQDRVTERVAGALQPSIRGAEVERARRKPPQDLSAYDAAMRAMPQVWALEKEACAKALELLERALAIDPAYPLALSLAGWCYGQRMVYNWTEDMENARRRALQYAEKAVELGGDDPLILTVLGAVYTFVRNFGRARSLLERAVMMDANAAWAWSRLGWLEVYSDRPDKAVECFERALRLSPLDPMNFNNYAGLGAAHQNSGRFDMAMAFFGRALAERPNIPWVRRATASALAAAGRIEEAKAEMKLLLDAYPGLTIRQYRAAVPYSEATLEAHCKLLREAGLPE